MDCGARVQQCGVLSIDTGLGFFGGINGSSCANSSAPTGCTDQTNPPYRQPRAKVHGLWFETPPYGSSACLHSADWDTACQNQSWVFAPDEYCAEQECDDGLPACYSVKALPACYDGYQGNFSGGARGQLERRYMLWFVNHEWRKHGTCGRQVASTFFGQVCAAAANLTSAIDAYRREGLDNYTDISTIACRLTTDFDHVEVSSVGPDAYGTNGEIRLSACLDAKTGQWHVAPVNDFDRLCGDSEFVRGVREVDLDHLAQSPPTAQGLMAMGGGSGGRRERGVD
jgi:ribonuclease I